MSKSFDSIAILTPPGGICPQCAQQGMEHLPSGTLFLYCRHSGTGAVRRPAGTWRTVEGMDADRFRNLVLLATLEGEQQFIEAATAGLARQ
jgi:hypothetical protein